MCMYPAWKLRKEMVHYSKLIYERSLSSATDGNLSCKIADERILITPSGLHKGFLTEEDLVVIDLEGKKLSGKNLPSSEYNTHLYIYKNRKDVEAIVHAHPPYCIAFTVAGVPLDTEALPEVILSLGNRAREESTQRVHYGQPMLSAA